MIKFILNYEAPFIIFKKFRNIDRYAINYNNINITTITLKVYANKK